MKRLQRSRKLGYVTPPNTLYCGRGSMFGNPFVVVEIESISHAWWCIDVPENKRTFEIEKILFSYFRPLESKELAMQDCLKCFEVYAENYLIDKLHLLKGKNLSCWCAPDQPCHVDILIKLYNKYYPTTDGN